MTMRNRVLFTVFTPTYNRARVLHRVYESLCAQTFRDFEWLIVDDGSTDNTCDIVKSWQNSSNTWFPIRYIRQKHGHKKIAFNRGVREARGELFLPFDSDDRCVPHALERFAHHWFNIPEEERSGFAGVTSLCADEEGNIIGDRFPCEHWIDSNSLEMKYRYKVKGEKWGFIRTEILKLFPFPENIPGYVPEGVVWMQIARFYKTRFINEVLRIYYRDDSKQITAAKNPEKYAIGYLYWKQQILSYEIDYFRYDPLSFILDAIRLTRFYLHCENKKDVKYFPNSTLGKILTMTGAPLGLLWYLIDKLRY